MPNLIGVIGGGGDLSKVVPSFMKPLALSKDVPVTTGGLTNNADGTVTLFLNAPGATGNPMVALFAFDVTAIKALGLSKLYMKYDSNSLLGYSNRDRTMFVVATTVYNPNLDPSVPVTGSRLVNTGTNQEITLDFSSISAQFAYAEIIFENQSADACSLTVKEMKFTS